MPGICTPSQQRLPTKTMGILNKEHSVVKGTKNFEGAVKFLSLPGSTCARAHARPIFLASEVANFRLWNPVHPCEKPWECAGFFSPIQSSAVLSHLQRIKGATLPMNRQRACGLDSP